VRDVLNGERVRLAAVTEADLPLIARWRSDSEFLRLYDAEPAMPKTEAQLRKWLDERQTNPTAYLFGIRLLDDDRLIGHCDVDDILWPHRVAWVSIGIGDADDRGRGYGAEALELLLRFAFHELNLHRIQLSVFSYNTRAIATYQRLGFTHEGTFREFLERDGQHHDMLLYGLLRAEWEEGNREQGTVGS
jgi:RimJ/RimL family protein N-acetyltransferase